MLLSVCLARRLLSYLSRQQYREKHESVHTCHSYCSTLLMGVRERESLFCGRIQSNAHTHITRHYRCIDSGITCTASIVMGMSPIGVGSAFIPMLKYGIASWAASIFAVL